MLDQNFNEYGLNFVENYKITMLDDKIDFNPCLVSSKILYILKYYIYTKEIKILLR